MWIIQLSRSWSLGDDSTRLVEVAMSREKTQDEQRRRCGLKKWTSKKWIPNGRIVWFQWYLTVDHFVEEVKPNNPDMCFLLGLSCPQERHILLESDSCWSCLCAQLATGAFLEAPSSRHPVGRSKFRLGSSASNNLIWKYMKCLLRSNHSMIPMVLGLGSTYLKSQIQTYSKRFCLLLPFPNTRN